LSNKSFSYKPRPSTETQRVARKASGKRLADAYRKYEFAPLCPCRRVRGRAGEGQAADAGREDEAS
jgi:hypothetical protein